MIDLTDDLDALRDDWGVEITFIPKVGSSVTISDAIRHDEPADLMEGRSMRRIAFELPASSLSRDPAKEDAIRDAAGTVWLVTQVKRLDEAGAWYLDVERSTRT
ncbi:hypothetical protein [Tardibacter chloracetimidivorans]|nr:hypothetical protein [Tardibacter chloracetimidivorans]